MDNSNLYITICITADIYKYSVWWRMSIIRHSSIIRSYIDRPLCPLQRARTEHLPVPPPLRRSWIDHSPGLCLPHVRQHLTWTQLEEGTSDLLKGNSGCFLKNIYKFKSNPSQCREGITWGCCCVRSALQRSIMRRASMLWSLFRIHYSRPK